MMRRGSMLAALLVMLLFAITPAVYAQSTQVDTGQILAQLAPRSQYPYNILDIIVYVIFFVGLITMFLVPDKQLLATLLMVAVVGMAVLGKIGFFQPDEFPTFVVNVGMFVIPLLVAGMLRARPGKTPAALLPAIATGFFGGVYFFLYWFLLQRG